MHVALRRDLVLRLGVLTPCRSSVSRTPGSGLWVSSFGTEVGSPPVYPPTRRTYYELGIQQLSYGSHTALLHRWPRAPAISCAFALAEHRRAKEEREQKFLCAMCRSKMLKTLGSRQDITSGHSEGCATSSFFSSLLCAEAQDQRLARLQLDLSQPAAPPPDASPRVGCFAFGSPKT
jgi:hypothetical protein